MARRFLKPDEAASAVKLLQFIEERIADADDCVAIGLDMSDECKVLREQQNIVKGLLTKFTPPELRNG